MKNALSKNARWIALPPVAILAACAVTATTALWQSQAGGDGTTGLLLGSAYDSTGNLYQIYRFGSYSEPQVFLRNVSANGEERWQLQTSTGTSAGGSPLIYNQVTACDSGVIVSGQNRNRIEKYDTQGHLEWKHDFATAGKNESQQIIVDHDCNPIVARTLQPGEDMSHPLEIDQFNAQGNLLWSQTVSLPDGTYSNNYINVSQLADGRIRLVLLMPSAPNDIVELDTAGTVIRRESLGEESGWVLASDDDRIVMMVGHNTFESRNPDGSLAWSQTIDASIGKCAVSSRDSLLCFANASTDLHPELIRFDLTSGNPTFYPVNYNGWIDALVWLGGNRWLVQESIYGNATLARFVAQPYYARLHILDDSSGKETSTITLQPGKSGQTFIEECLCYIWNQSAPRDNTQAFHLLDQALRVSGWFGESVDYAGTGIIHAKAYAIK